MEEQQRFSQRVKETVIQCADLYKKYYVEYEYLLCSKAFQKNEYYIISAHEDNYLHLTGLHTKLDATSFFEKKDTYFCGTFWNFRKYEITDNYPFKRLESTSRSYIDRQKMQQFKKDGFIDRYSGDKLVNPGFLNVLSHYMPDEFPYHSHWKMEACHNAYFGVFPQLIICMLLAIMKIGTD